MLRQLQYTTSTTPLHYNYSCATPHIQQLWVRWSLQPLQPHQTTQLQPPFGPSVGLLCHPCITTIHRSYSVLSLIYITRSWLSLWLLPHFGLLFRERYSFHFGGFSASILSPPHFGRSSLNIPEFILLNTPARVLSMILCIKWWLLFIPRSWTLFVTIKGLKGSGHSTPCPLTLVFSYFGSGKNRKSQL